MGNSGGTERESDEKFARFLETMTLVRKEHSDNLGKDIDLYQPNHKEFDEDLVLVIEMVFDDPESRHETATEVVKRFKTEVNLRKNFNCPFISQLIFVNYKVFSGICVEKMMCRLAFEYSEENLFKDINDGRTIRSSMMNSDYAPAPVVLHFVTAAVEALFFLKKNGRRHGFIKPENILIYNRRSPKPLYKLVDVALISKFPKSTHQLL